MKTGIEIISKERKRQIEVEGYDESHDDKEKGNQLALAAACYTIPSYVRNVPVLNNRKTVFDIIWNWDYEFWKPTPENRIKELAKAGALIAAKIDRLQRLNNK